MWILVEFSMFVVSEMCLRRICMFILFILYGFAIRIPVTICLIRIVRVYQYRNFAYVKAKYRGHIRAMLP